MWSNATNCASGTATCNCSFQRLLRWVEWHHFRKVMCTITLDCFQGLLVEAKCLYSVLTINIATVFVYLNLFIIVKQKERNIAPGNCMQILKLLGNSIGIQQKQAMHSRNAFWSPCCGSLASTLLAGALPHSRASFIHICLTMKSIRWCLWMPSAIWPIWLQQQWARLIYLQAILFLNDPYLWTF